jgi:hypothetical protein
MQRNAYLQIRFAGQSLKLINRSFWIGTIKRVAYSLYLLASKAGDTSLYLGKFGSMASRWSCINTYQRFFTEVEGTRELGLFAGS